MLGRAALALALVSGLASAAAAAPVVPETVAIVGDEPRGCQYAGDIKVDTGRLLPVLRDDDAGRKALRKGKHAVTDAQAKAAALGADTILVPAEHPDAKLLAGSAKTYRCRGGAEAPAAAAAAEASSSEAQRKGKEFAAVFEPVGIATPLGLGQAITASLYLDADHLLELSAAYASVKRGDSQSFSLAGATDGSFGDNARIDGHSSSVAVRYKAFVTNSFYWYAGVADRITEAALYVVPESGDSTQIAHVSAHDLGPTAAIGNQWQWDDLTIGCDWIGVYVPLLQVKKSYDEASVDLSAYDNNMSGARDTFKTYTTGLNVTGLRFYIGASF